VDTTYIYITTLIGGFKFHASADVQNDELFLTLRANNDTRTYNWIITHMFMLVVILTIEHFFGMMYTVWYSFHRIYTCFLFNTNTHLHGILKCVHLDFILMLLFFSRLIYPLKEGMPCFNRRYF